MTATKRQLASRRRWLSALKFDGYPQTRCTLENQHGYCCLGVACVVLGVSTRDDEGDMGGVLPEKAMKRLGMRTEGGLFIGDDGQITSLVKLNDEVGLSFEQIAAVVESNPLGLWAGDDRPGADRVPV